MNSKTWFVIERKGEETGHTWKRHRDPSNPHTDAMWTAAERAEHDLPEIRERDYGEHDMYRILEVEVDDERFSMGSTGSPIPYRTVREVKTFAAIAGYRQ